MHPLVCSRQRTAGPTICPGDPLGDHGQRRIAPALVFEPILPLVGWGMLSAERYPIVRYAPLQLPSILPHNVALYAWLRSLRTDLAHSPFSGIRRGVLDVRPVHVSSGEFQIGFDRLASVPGVADNEPADHDHLVPMQMVDRLKVKIIRTHR